MIDTTEIDNADVLAALYNASKPLGVGSMHFDSARMSGQDAQDILDMGQDHFDYLKGRVMKVKISGNTLDPWGYDRDNGPGAAQRAITSIKETA